MTALPTFGGDRAINPAKFFAEWNGQTGTLYYNFKDADNKWKDKAGNRYIHTFSDKFTFIFLASLNTVKGFSDDDQNGFYANEVRDVRVEPFVVKCGKRLAAKGLWSMIKDDIKPQGAKFCKSIYIAFKDEDETIQIGNIQATGAFMAAWFEFVKQNPSGTGAVQIAGTEDRKKGTVNYKVPIFKMVKVSEETLAQASVRVDELNDYLQKYFAQGSVMFDTSDDEPDTGDMPVDDQFGDNPLPDTEPEFIDDESDEIPF